MGIGSSRGENHASDVMSRLSFGDTDETARPSSGLRQSLFVTAVGPTRHSRKSYRSQIIKFDVESSNHEALILMPARLEAPIEPCVVGKRPTSC
jgi:hypothetical protein